MSGDEEEDPDSPPFVDTTYLQDAVANAHTWSALRREHFVYDVSGALLGRAYFNVLPDGRTFGPTALYDLTGRALLEDPTYTYEASGKEELIILPRQVQ